MLLIFFRLDYEACKFTNFANYESWKARYESFKITNHDYESCNSTATTENKTTTYSHNYVIETSMNDSALSQHEEAKVADYCNNKNDDHKYLCVGRFTIANKLEEINNSSGCLQPKNSNFREVNTCTPFISNESTKGVGTISFEIAQSNDANYTCLDQINSNHAVYDEMSQNFEVSDSLSITVNQPQSYINRAYLSTQSLIHRMTTSFSRQSIIGLEFTLKKLIKQLCNNIVVLYIWKFKS